MNDSDFEDYSGPALDESQFEDYENPDVGTPLESEIRQNQADKPAGGMRAEAAEGSSAANLPMPSEGMYDGMDPNDAFDLYSAYVRHPFTEKTQMGETLYKGQRIPTPQNLAENANGPIGAAVDIAGGAFNAGKETVKNALGSNELINSGIEKLPGWMQGPAHAVKNTLNPMGAVGDIAQAAGVTAQSVDQGVPSYESDNPVGQFTSEVSQIGTGVLLGGKVKPEAWATAQNATKKLISKLSGYTGASAGAAMTADEDSQTMVTGDNAFVADILPAFAIDENGDYNQNLFKKRLNLMGDAFATGKVVEGAVAAPRALKTGFSWLGERLGAIGSDTAKQKDAALDFAKSVMDLTSLDTEEGYVNALEKARDAVNRGKGETVESGTPGVSDITTSRDTADAFVQGMDKITPQQVASAEGFRNNVSSGGATELQGKRAQPSLDLKNAVDQSSEIFGGKGTQEQAKKSVLETADRDIKSYNDVAEGVNTQLTTAKDDLTHTNAADSLVDKGFSQTQNQGLRIDPTKQVRESKDKIVGQMDDNLVKDKKTRNQKYADIANISGPVDSKKFQQVWDDIEGTLPEDIEEQARKIITENYDGTFESINSKIAPQLTKLKDKMYNSNQNGSAVGKLRDRMLQEVGNPDHPVVKEANRYMKEDFGKKWNDGVGQRFRENRKKLAPWEEINRGTQGRDIISSAFSKDTPEEVQQLKSIVGEEPLRKLAKAEAVYSVADDIANGKLSELTAEKLLTPFRKYQAVFDDNGKKDIEGFINGLVAKKNNVEELTKSYKAALDEANEVRKQITEKELSKFYNKGIPKTGKDALKSYFEEGDIQSIKQLRNRVLQSDNKLAEDGLKSGFIDYFKSRSFRDGRAEGGRLNMNKSAMSDEKLFEMGDEILKDNPTLWKLLKHGLKESDKIENTAQGKIPVEAKDKYDLRARGAIDFVITQTFGTLDKMGSRLRSAAKNIIAGNSTKEAVGDAYDKIMSNPELFASILDKEIKNIKGKVPKEVYRKIYRSAGLAFGWDMTKEDEFVKDASGTPEEDQTKKMLKK